MQINLTLEVLDNAEGKDYRVVKLAGEFDKAGHSDIQEDFDSLVKGLSESVLVLDFSGLKFINSEGIGYLMEVHTHLLKRDKKLVLVQVLSNVRDVFETIGIGEIIPIYTNLSDFLSR